MYFAYGRDVVVVRAGLIREEYSGREVRADWDNPERITVEDAFVASTSTSMLAGATRQQALESKSLFCSPDADIQKGDRVEDAGVLYTIDGIPPAADQNPFTGWESLREIPLSRTVG